MDQRQDAMLAAARFIVAVNDAVRAEPGRQVATVGRVVPKPNTTNVIAGQVVLNVDLRDLDAKTVARLGAQIEFVTNALTNSIPDSASASRRGVSGSRAP